METLFNTDKFWSAVKRRSMSEVLAIVFEETGHTEAAEIAGSTTRLTDAAIRRMRETLGEVAETVEETGCEIAETEPEEPNELIELEQALIKALDKGKKKKAKKAFEALKEAGLKGAMMVEYRRKIKEL